jgi:hypothetical protein
MPVQAAQAVILVEVGVEVVLQAMLGAIAAREAQAQRGTLL